MSTSLRRLCKVFLVWMVVLMLSFDTATAGLLCRMRARRSCCCDPCATECCKPNAPADDKPIPETMVEPEPAPEKEPAKEPAKEPVEPAEPPKEPAKEPAEPAEPAKEPAKDPAEPAEPAKEPAKDPAEPAEPAKEPAKDPAEPAEPAKEPAKDPAAPAEPAKPAPAKPAEDDPFKASVETPVRFWTDDTGSFRVEASLVEVLEGKVRLLKSNGRYSTVSLDRLSQADRDYVEQYSAQLVASTLTKLAER